MAEGQTPADHLSEVALPDCLDRVGEHLGAAGAPLGMAQALVEEAAERLRRPAADSVAERGAVVKTAAGGRPESACSLGRSMPSVLTTAGSADVPWMVPYR